MYLLSLQRLQSKIIKLVDVSYGGENGFNQAIELAAESLQNVKFIQEKKLIGRYFDEISQVIHLFVSSWYRRSFTTIYFNPVLNFAINIGHGQILFWR